jgi:hypothetical protein
MGHVESAAARTARKVFRANFGSGNWAWQECLNRHSIAIMDDVRVHPYWKRRDIEGYVATAMRDLRTSEGEPPTLGTATRWYNINTEFMESADDIWIHREGDFLWWTISKEGEPASDIRDDPEPAHGKTKMIVYHKPCLAWSQRDRNGQLLRWNSIHPKAQHFLAKQGTFQQLSDDNAAYARALIDAADLSAWHQQPDWSAKQRRSSNGAVKILTPEEILPARMSDTAKRMVQTAWDTCLQSGQTSTTERKNKLFGFASQTEMEEFTRELMKMQGGICALTGLKMLLDDEAGDAEFRCSLDRIDSAGHYERGNLQVVCKFVNRWKGDMPNEDFTRLLAHIRAAPGSGGTEAYSRNWTEPATVVSHK